MKLIYSILFLCCCLFARATDYTVSSVEEFNTALSNIHSGDGIIWKNGTYADCKLFFKPKEKGTAKQRIYFKAETSGKVKFTGGSCIIISGEYLQVEGFLFEGIATLQTQEVLSFSNNSNHCRITNCAVLNYSPKDSAENNNWISLQGFYNEVDHCSFSGKTNQGPYLVVRYQTGKDFTPGSDKAPSTFHHIHHNYFGYRTLPTDNGGEDMRIGDSKTSFTHGFNIIEYNYFERHRLEPEVISNKSCDNIYRFNTFIDNDGSLVLRHGQRCFVYGNYFNGSGNKNSGGIRIVNAQQTVFNNYLENLEGGDQAMKSPITIMSGLVGSALNEYYPADSALVAYNTISNSVGPVIGAGIGNESKGKPFVAPKNLMLVSNLIINIQGKNKKAIIEKDGVTYSLCQDNKYTDGDDVSIKGFEKVSRKKVMEIDGISYVNEPADKNIVKMINQRLAVHGIQLLEKEITRFNPKWILRKNDVGADWMKD